MNKRYRRTILLWGLVYVVLSCTTYLTYHHKRKNVSIGYPIIEGFQERSETGKYYGYNYEIIAEIAKQNRWNVSFVEGTYDGLLHKLLVGEIDLLGGVNEIKQEYTNQVVFAKYASGTNRSVILSKQPTSYINNYAALQHMTLGFLYPSKAYNDFKKATSNHNITTNNLFYPSVLELKEALALEQVDAISFSSNYVFDPIQLIGEFARSDFFLVGRATYASIIDDVNQTQAFLQTNQPYFYDILYQKYYVDHKKDAPVLNTSNFYSLQGRSAFFLILVLLLFYVLKFFYQNHYSPVRRSFLRAFRKQEMVLYYAPIADIQSSEVSMFSLHYFWDSKEYGLLNKHQMMELKGNTLNLTYRMHEANLICKQLAKIQNIENYQSTKFIIQIHSEYSSYFSLISLILIVQYFSKRHGVNTHQLMFAFSSNIVQDEKTKLRISKSFKKFGIATVNSDFGLQFSSLSQIKKIDYDMFFIDHLYAADYMNNDVSYQIVKLIVNIANSLGKQTIIDGIHTLDSYEFAKALGCNHMRGQFIGTRKTFEELSQTTKKKKHYDNS